MVGHNVTMCGTHTECEKEVAKGKFDVVLADPSDAAGLKARASGVVPVALKPTKEELNQLKADYSVAFDASRDALRLLPLLSKITKAASKR
jgi:hypothetical protein